MPIAGATPPYNYESFVPDNFEHWLNFENSPPLGRKAPDFPLWPLEGGVSSLGAILSEYTYTIVEFGSFT
ncbi:hypothetical protein BH23ACT11_BH23ACT11_13030 [soil metagenome]